MVREILDSGVDVNARVGSHIGMTALHCAAETPGCEAIVKLLLKRGANVHAKTSDPFGWTALHFAVAHSKDMVRQLLKKGA
jgi:ankyrin repeat protein